MPMNRIQFQPGLSMSEFLNRHGTEGACEAALEQARWPTGFRSSRCDGTACSRVRGRTHALFQCQACRHQTSLIALTVMQSTKLPLTIWFLALHLISQASTGLSALALERHLGVSYPTAWRVHDKLMQAMAEGETPCLLDGQVQLDDACLGGERSGGKVGQSSENKLPFVAAVSLGDEACPLRVKLTPVSGLSLNAIGRWARTHLAPGSTVLSDGLACFAAGRAHLPTVVGRRKPKDLPAFQWINTLPGNLKTRLSGSYHAFHFRKHATRYLAAFSYRFKRRFDPRVLQT